MKVKAILLGLLAASIVFFLGVHAYTVNANPCYWCHTPTPTPTHTPRPTHTPKPCDDDWNEKNPCHTPTPTPTDIPTATPSATPTSEPSSEPRPLSVPEAPQQPACNSDLTVAPTILSFSRPTPNSVHLTWSETGNVDSYIVYYGTSEFQLPWNTTVSHSHEVVLNNVPNENIWVKVAATDNICVGPSSVTIDP